MATPQVDNMRPIFRRLQPKGMYRAYTYQYAKTVQCTVLNSCENSYWKVAMWNDPQYQPLEELSSTQLFRSFLKSVSRANVHIDKVVGLVNIGNLILSSPDTFRFSELSKQLLTDEGCHVEICTCKCFWGGKMFHLQNQKILRLRGWNRAGAWSKPDLTIKKILM